MMFLFLWSGNKTGFKKFQIDAIENTVGTVGHWRNGKCYLPDPEQLRAAIPKRYLPAYDRAVNWHGLPQIWCDATNNDSPLTMRLLNSRGKYLVNLYLQPMKESI